MSTGPDVRPFGYWDQFGRHPDWWLRLNDSQQERLQRLVIEFYAASMAYSTRPDPENTPPSLDNCERSPTSGKPSGKAAETVDPLSESERELVNITVSMGADVERAIEIVRAGGGSGRGANALFAALERDDPDRQARVLGLLERGETTHAYNLATCGRKSVQLQCGDCGSDENFVPVSCDSRLCPDCQDKQVGRNIAKYKCAVHQMDQPKLLTLTETNFRDPIDGRETVMDDFGKLRRKTIPFSGSTRREASEDEDGEIIEKSWCWWEGGDVENGDEETVQWKVGLQSEGNHDLVRRLQDEFVNYEYENITGTHIGRNIPFDELFEGGIYGIDVKQQGRFEYNVHVHVLIDMAFIPQAALSAVWEDITGDSCVVDVRSIYDRRDGCDDVEEALSETVGYAVKPAEIDDLEDELEFVEAAKGSASVHPFGSLHGTGSSMGSLVCCECYNRPLSWEYLGTIDETRETVEHDWDEGGKDPPDEDRDVAPRQ